MSLPSAHDVWFLVRAILTRPGDVPGILRRGAAKKRANLPTGRGADPHGLRFLTDSWEAALAAGAFRAPPGEGPALTIDRLDDPAAAATALQTASSVRWRAPTGGHPLGALSLEAARLSLPQNALRPERVAEARRGFIAATDMSAGLRAALEDLSKAEVSAP